MNWKFKALVFKVLGVIPFGSELHYQLQRQVLKTWPRDRKIVEALAEHARKSVKIFSKYSSCLVEKSVFLEIGGGRDLVVPLALRMLGVSKVVSTDVQRLANLDLINHSAGLLSEIMGCELAYFSSWEELREYGIDYRAPFFIDKNFIAEDPINQDSDGMLFDVLVSNEVLEHIPKVQLVNILNNSKDFLKPGGLSIHSIDYSDHYARNCGISRHNFLKYTNREWKKYNSRIQFVNRLRHSDYVNIFLDAGLSILEENVYSEPVPPNIKDNIGKDFESYSDDDMEILRSRIVARRV